jgi:hypothetical protein
MTQHTKDSETKPTIALDCANIACAFANSTVPGDAIGIIKAYEHHHNLGHQVVLFVKQYRLSNRNKSGMMLHTSELLNSIPEEAIAIVPSRTDDDAFFIDFCMKNNAVLITNDGLKDHENRLQGDVKKAFFTWRETHKCGFMFALEEFMPEPDFRMPTHHEIAKNLGSKDSTPAKRVTTTPNSNLEAKTTASGQISQTTSGLTEILRANLQPEMKVQTMGLEMVDWCNESWGTSFNSAREIRVHVGLPISPPMSEILTRLLGNQVRFTGTAHQKICHFNGLEPELKSYLRTRIKNWFRVTRLGQELAAKYGSESPRSVMKEHANVTGRTFSIQLRRMFESEGLIFRGEKGQTEVRLNPPTGSSTSDVLTSTTSSIQDNIPIQLPVNESMDDVSVVTQVLEILEVPEHGRFSKLLRYFRLSGSRWSGSTMNYALIGQQFQEMTGIKIREFVPKPSVLCQMIRNAHPRLTGEIDGDLFTVRARRFWER